MPEPLLGAKVDGDYAESLLGSQICSRVAVLLFEKV